MEQGIKTSPLLNDFQNQILSNKIDSLRLAASYGFIVSGEGNALYAPSYNSWGYDKALSNGQSIFAGVRVSKEFLSNKNLQARLYSFSLLQKQLEAQEGLSRLTLKKQIADQYLSAFTSQKLLGVLTEIKYLLYQEDIVLRKLTQAAVFKQTDYLSFKVKQQQNELMMKQREAEFLGNLALLRYYSGVEDTFTVILAAPYSDDSIQTAYKQSPYYEKYSADSVKFSNDGTLLKYNYRPRILGFTDAGYQSTLEQQPYKNLGVSVGVSISIPLYDGHKRALQEKQNALALQTSSRYNERQSKKYSQLQFQLQQQRNKYIAILTTAAEQVKFARTLVDANARQLPTGDVKMVDFILSINNLLDLKTGIIQTNNILLQIQLQLQYLILP